MRKIPHRVPLATYRLQFSPGFGFRDALKILSYLRDLGATDIYASPIFKAVRGSRHGYDVVDPNKLNPELGSRRDFMRFVGRLRRLGMGVLQDIVPNHMALSYENRLLADVLERGVASIYADFFDILWDHPDADLKGRVLVPLLGGSVEQCLREGEIGAGYCSRGFFLRYFDNRFPVSAEGSAGILARVHKIMKLKAGEDHIDTLRLGAILSGFPVLSGRKGRGRRARSSLSWKNDLRSLYLDSALVQECMHDALDAINGDGRASRLLLRTLIYGQHYLLTHWCEGLKRINYRRFFTINGLVAVRMDRREVFEHAHRLVIRLLNQGVLNGLRIDHIDGLLDPATYIEWVREHAPEAYIVAEKILGPREKLPEWWGLQGTTGYDFLNMVNGLFCSGRNAKLLRKVYVAFTGVSEPFEDITYRSKKLIACERMAGDIDNLARMASGMACGVRAHRFSFGEIRSAVVELLAAFPLYRTYISGECASGEDRSVIEYALKRARRRSKGNAQALEAVGDLLLRGKRAPSQGDREERLLFTMKFQQLAAPVMAKGYEDTALYRYCRLLSLNEVGGRPESPGVKPDEFHQYIAERMKAFPHSMNATSTHDTKRGEDVRARLNVISEIPGDWSRRVLKWRETNSSLKRKAGGQPVPDAQDEYFLYQTLVGTFPFTMDDYEEFVERIKKNSVKTVREAKRHGSWIDPDEEYEREFCAFIDDVLTPEPGNAFLRDFIPFQARIARFGVYNSLSQVLLKLTAPGVPDLYQGSELWDLSLVDPDNRRPVDFAQRRSFLKELGERFSEQDRQAVPEALRGTIRTLLLHPQDGRVKLYVLFRTLHARRAVTELFQLGEYIPLRAGGPYRDHVIAFAKTRGPVVGISLAPRFLTSLVDETSLPVGMEVWRETTLALPFNTPLHLKEVFTGRTIEVRRDVKVGEILSEFPLALMIGGKG